MTSPVPPRRPTRVLLSVRHQNGAPVNAEIGEKTATYLARQTGVIKAEGSVGGNLELHYDADAVTLTDLTRALTKAGLRVGIV